MRAHQWHLWLKLLACGIPASVNSVTLRQNWRLPADRRLALRQKIHFCFARRLFRNTIR
jgi:hypothetical protein